MKTMKQLLKDYELKSDQEYFDMIIDSVINGQRNQAKKLFNLMPRKVCKIRNCLRSFSWVQPGKV